MTDRRIIALDFLRLAQVDLVRASTLVASRIELARQYGATEDDITNTLRTEGGQVAEGPKTLYDVPNRLLAAPESGAAV